MRSEDLIEVQANVKLTLYERGKIVARREGHNVFLDTGRKWLTESISLSGIFDAPVYAVGTPDPADFYGYRPSYVGSVGFGVGGELQTDLGYSYYGGGNLQSDTDPAVSKMERPVEYISDTFLKYLSYPPNFITSRHVTYTLVLDASELHVKSNTTPLSEVGLFTTEADGQMSGVEKHSRFATASSPYLIAYHVFETVNKTNSMSGLLEWQLRF